VVNTIADAVARRARPLLASPQPALAWLCVGAGVAVSGLVGIVAADARWLAALGGAIVHQGAIPDGVPYASAPSDNWSNVPVLGELVFHLLHSAAGERGFLVAQVVAVAIALSLLLLDTRAAGAGERAAGFAILLVIAAAFAPLVLIRAQLFSLALAPLLYLLLRAEARAPSRRVWLLVPLLALWSNLHGAALVGLAVAAAYLLLERARREPWTALAVLTASSLALCATPALWRTPRYYLGVLGNEAARRGTGLWAPLSFHRPTDVILMAGGLVLLAAALRSRPRLWELAVLAGLAVLTVHVSRTGVWFVLFAAVPAALGLRGRPVSRPRLAWPALLFLIAAAGLGIGRGPTQTAAGKELLARALDEAAGTPILATGPIAEQIALRGGRIWIGNPIDAFRRRAQRLYLDWLEGRPAGDAALGEAPRVVIVAAGSPAQRRLAEQHELHLVARDRHAVLYVSRRPVRAP
jgi:hypothetical protein